MIFVAGSQAPRTGSSVMLWREPTHARYFLKFASASPLSVPFSTSIAVPSGAYFLKRVKKKVVNQVQRTRVSRSTSKLSCLSPGLYIPTQMFATSVTLAIANGRPTTATTTMMDRTEYVLGLNKHRNLGPTGLDKTTMAALATSGKFMVSGWVY